MDTNALFQKENMCLDGITTVPINKNLYNAAIKYGDCFTPKNDDESFGIGEKEDTVFVENSNEEFITLMTYSKDGIVKVVTIDAANNKPCPKADLDIETLLIALMASGSKLNTAITQSIMNIRDILTDTPVNDWTSVYENLTTLEQTLYNRINNPKPKVKEIPLVLDDKKNFTGIALSSVENGGLSPSKLLVGDFKHFVLNSGETFEFNEESEVIKTDGYKINEKRVFTEEENGMMFEIPDFYKFSSNVLSVAQKIKTSWNRPAHLKAVNILFEGPAGTGKTMDAMVLSSLLGLPYTKITCFSDMDSSDVVGSILPVASDDKEDNTVQMVDSCNCKLPSDLTFPSSTDMMFDAVGSWEQLTGEILETATSEQCHKFIAETLSNYYDTEEGKNTPEYVYYASEIVKAFENGWLLEVQEPTCIADAAVLLILNSALEKNGVINLPQRTVRRHDDFICVMTTNRNYEGCRPLNQALRDRFNITKKLDLPPTKELADRLVAYTDSKNRKFVNNVCKMAKQLNSFLESISINAEVSIRGLGDLILDVEEGMDIRKALDEDVLWKITTDDEDLAEIYTELENSTMIYNDDILKNLKLRTPAK